MSTSIGVWPASGRIWRRASGQEQWVRTPGGPRHRRRLGSGPNGQWCGPNVESGCRRGRPPSTEQGSFPAFSVRYECSPTFGKILQLFWVRNNIDAVWVLVRTERRLANGLSDSVSAVETWRWRCAIQRSLKVRYKSRCKGRSQFGAAKICFGRSV